MYLKQGAQRAGRFMLPGSYLSQKEFGLAHDIKQRRAQVKQCLIPSAQEHEVPLLCRLL